EATIFMQEAVCIMSGGVNCNAIPRRYSTDMEHIFHAHIGGMDSVARAFITADRILSASPLKKMKQERYASFDQGQGKAFEEGKLSLEDLRNFAAENGEPAQISGKQELYENIVNKYI